MTVLLLLIVWLLPALFVHLFYSITLTATQRLGILAAINRHDPLHAISKMEALRAVEFDDHLWRVTTFRRPWSLYPDQLREETRAVHF